MPTLESEAGMVRITRDTTGVDFPCGVYVDIAGLVDPRLLASYARLFAAAPILLAALEAVAEFLDDGVPDTSEMVSDHERNVRELVRVGLRRARGED